MPYAVHRERCMDDSIEERTLEIVCNLVAVGVLDHLRTSELFEVLEQQLGSLSQELWTCFRQTAVCAIDDSRMTDLAAPNQQSHSTVHLKMHRHASEDDMQAGCNVSGSQDMP